MELKEPTEDDFDIQLLRNPMRGWLNILPPSVWRDGKRADKAIENKRIAYNRVCWKFKKQMEIKWKSEETKITKCAVCKNSLPKS